MKKDDLIIVVLVLVLIFPKALGKEALQEPLEPNALVITSRYNPGYRGHKNFKESWKLLVMTESGKILECICSKQKFKAVKRWDWVTVSLYQGLSSGETHCGGTLQ